MFAGAHENASTDSGVSSRLVSYFLKWLANRANDSTVFVIATMNRTSGIPEEMLRTGRFDRIFGTSLPDVNERIEHLRIHLNRYSQGAWEYTDAELKMVAQQLNQFTGSEIEEVVVSAVHTAFDRAIESCNEEDLDYSKFRPTVDDMLGEAQGMKILAKVKPEELKSIIDFCEARTVPVTSPAEQTQVLRNIDVN